MGGGAPFGTNDCLVTESFFVCRFLACNLNNAKEDSPNYLLYRSERSARASVCLILSYDITTMQIGDNKIGQLELIKAQSWWKPCASGCWAASLECSLWHFNSSLASWYQTSEIFPGKTCSIV